MPPSIHWNQSQQKKKSKQSNKLPRLCFPSHLMLISWLMKANTKFFSAVMCPKIVGHLNCLASGCHRRRWRWSEACRPGRPDCVLFLSLCYKIWDKDQTAARGQSIENTSLVTLTASDQKDEQLLTFLISSFWWWVSKEGEGNLPRGFICILVCLLPDWVRCPYHRWIVHFGGICLRALY